MWSVLLYCVCLGGSVIPQELEMHNFISSEIVQNISSLYLSCCLVKKKPSIYCSKKEIHVYRAVSVWANKFNLVLGIKSDINAPLVSSLPSVLATFIIIEYCIAQNFGGRKLWWIWCFIANLPKFYPPKSCKASWAPILNGLCLCQPPKFSPPIFLQFQLRQSFVLYGIALQWLMQLQSKTAGTTVYWKTLTLKFGEF